MSPRRVRHLLLAALLIHVVTVAACLGLRRAAADRMQDLARRQRTLRALAPDLERLARYEAIETALRAAQPEASQPPEPPVGSPAPDLQEHKPLPTVGAWSGIQVELGWTHLETAAALRLASHYMAHQPPWRLARLHLVALETTGACRLELRLESARPAAAPDVSP